MVRDDEPTKDEKDMKDTDGVNEAQAVDERAEAGAKAEETVSAEAVIESLRAEVDRLSAENAALRNDVEKFRKLGAEWQNQYLQLQADFRRHRQRTQEEAARLRERAAESLIGRLLPVFDDLERAAGAARDHDVTVAREALVQGVDMVRAGLYQVLQQAGLTPVETVAARFDPNIHEAVGFEITDKVPDGYVLQETRRGFRLGERLLRPAQVIVARSPGTDTEGQASSEGQEQRAKASGTDGKTEKGE